MCKAIKFIDAIKYAKDITEYNRINELKQSSIIKYSENE